LKIAFGSFKRVLLIITLLIPVCIYLFLKYFGENRYSLPVYYIKAADFPDRECDFSKFPYKIELFPFADANGNPCDSTWMRGRLSVVSIFDSIRHSEEMLKESNISQIISETGSTGKLQMIKVYVIGKSDSIRSRLGVPSKSVLQVTGSVSDVSHFARCGLILPDSAGLFNQWVLIDPLGRIRGYYDSRRFDEIDRLKVEIKILLREDEHVK
jgi:protein SCO1